LKLLAAEGESLAGERLKIGNTNTRLRFGLEPAPFINAWCSHGPAHHCALGVGHVLGKIKKVASLLDLELSVVGSTGARI
jgi:L-arabinose isomerase